MDLDASRIRRPSRRFGWVDRRVLHDGHLAGLGRAEAAVYLVLCVAADRHGLSWHPLQTLATWTKHAPESIEQALLELARRGLVATAGPLVQVMDLDLVALSRPGSAGLPAPSTKSVRPENRQHRRSPLTAPERLALLPAAVRQALIEQARQKLTRITNGREPCQSVVEAVACGLIRDPEGRP
jgi:hypothetical protein